MNASPVAPRLKVWQRVVLYALCGLSLILLFLHTLPVPTQLNQVTVEIQPLGSIAPDIIEAVQRSLEETYHIRTRRLAALPLPADAFFKPRSRYHARELLTYLDNIRSEDVTHIMGITAEDISIRTMLGGDWGIFGLASASGPASVISTFRIRFGNPSQQQMLARISKIAVHEMGHCLGLPHCTHSHLCVMQAAKGKIATVDRARLGLCSYCRNQLQKSLNMP